MTSRLDTARSQLTYVDHRGNHEGLLLAALDSATKESYNLYPYCMAPETLNLLSSHGLAVTNQSTINHGHGGNKALENYMYYVVLPTYLVDDFTGVSLKQSKFERICSASGQTGTLHNPIVSNRDLIRYPEAATHTVSTITTPFAFFADNIHYLQPADIMHIFLNSPELHTLFASAIIPVETITRERSWWPDLYQLQYHNDGTVVYAPEGQWGESYVQPIGAHQWLTTSCICTAELTLHVSVVHTKFAHHMISITRRPVMPSAYNCFDKPDLVRLPNFSMTTEFEHDMYVPLKVAKVMILYAHSMNTLQPRHIANRFRSYLADNKIALTTRQTEICVGIIRAFNESQLPEGVNLLIPTRLHHLVTRMGPIGYLRKHMPNPTHKLLAEFAARCDPEELNSIIPTKVLHLTESSPRSFMTTGVLPSPTPTALGELLGALISSSYLDFSSVDANEEHLTAVRDAFFEEITTPAGSYTPVTSYTPTPTLLKSTLAVTAPFWFPYARTFLCNLRFYFWSCFSFLYNNHRSVEAFLIFAGITFPFFRPIFFALYTAVTSYFENLFFRCVSFLCRRLVLHAPLSVQVLVLKMQMAYYPTIAFDHILAIAAHRLVVPLPAAPIEQQDNSDDEEEFTDARDDTSVLDDFSAPSDAGSDDDDTPSPVQAPCHASSPITPHSQLNTPPHTVTSPPLPPTIIPKTSENLNKPKTTENNAKPITVSSPPHPENIPHHDDAVAPVTVDTSHLTHYAEFVRDNPLTFKNLASELAIKKIIKNTRYADSSAQAHATCLLHAAQLGNRSQLRIVIYGEEQPAFVTELLSLGHEVVWYSYDAIVKPEMQHPQLSMRSFSRLSKMPETWLDRVDLVLIDPHNVNVNQKNDTAFAAFQHCVANAAPSTRIFAHLTSLGECASSYFETVRHFEREINFVRLHTQNSLYINAYICAARDNTNSRVVTVIDQARALTFANHLAHRTLYAVHNAAVVFESEHAWFASHVPASRQVLPVPTLEAPEGSSAYELECNATLLANIPDTPVRTIHSLKPRSLPKNPCLIHAFAVGLQMSPQIVYAHLVENAPAIRKAVLLTQQPPLNYDDLVILAHALSVRVNITPRGSWNTAAFPTAVNTEATNVIGITWIENYKNNNNHWLCTQLNPKNNIKTQNTKNNNSEVAQLAAELSACANHQTYSYPINTKRASALLKEIANEYIGVLHKTKAKKTKYFMSLANYPKRRTVKLSGILGYPGSGKSFEILNTLRNYVATHRPTPVNTFRLVSPTRSLREQNKNHLAVASDRSFLTPTWETCFYQTVGSILIVDELGQYPPGYIDALLVLHPTIEHVFFTGDPLQAVYHSTHPESMLNSSRSEIDHFSSFACTYRFITHRLARGVAAALNMPTSSRHTGRFVSSNSSRPYLPTLTLSTLQARRYSELGYPHVHTFAGSQGLSFAGDYQIILDGKLDGVTGRVLFTALTRGRANVYLVHSYTEEQIATGNHLVHQLLRHQNNTSFLAHLVGSFLPPHLRNALNTTTARQTVEPPSASYSDKYDHTHWLHSAIFNDMEENALDESHVEETSLLDRTLTTINPYESEAFLHELLDDIPAAHDREMYDSRSQSQTQQSNDELFRAQLFLRHTTKDEATTNLTFAKRLERSTPQKNQKQFKNTKGTGDLLFQAFTKTFKIESAPFDVTLYEECRREQEAVHLDKSEKTLENHQQRIDPDWPATKIELFLKNQTLTKLSTLGAKAKAGQSVSNIRSQYQLLMGPYGRYLARKTFSQLPPHIYIHHRQTPEKLSEFARSHWDHTKLSTERDYTMFDNAQRENVLHFEIKIMRYFHIPEAIISEYVNFKLNATCFFGPLAVFRFSGEWGTYFFNTIANMALFALSCHVDYNVAQGYAGDDAMYNDVVKYRLTWDRHQALFRLVTKSEETYYTTFCGWIIGKSGIIKSPTLIAARFAYSACRGTLHKTALNFWHEHSHFYAHGDAVHSALPAKCLEHVYVATNMFRAYARFDHQLAAAMQATFADKTGYI